MKSIFTLIIVFAFLSVFLTGCAKDEKKSHPKSLDEKKDTDISEGNADGEFPKANGGKSKDTLPEGKIESMFKESVMKIQDIAKPQKFALITDLATFTNSCANIHQGDSVSVCIHI